MKITEKLYVTRLEKMIRKYKQDPCDHCPMAEDFNGDNRIMMQPGENGKYDAKGCRICRNLTKRYADATNIKHVCDCPCQYFSGDINIVKVAWKVIRGWKKDNKQEVANE